MGTKKLQKDAYTIEKRLATVGKIKKAKIHGIVLIEINQIEVQEIPFAYLATVLRQFHEAKLVGFRVAGPRRSVFGKARLATTSAGSEAQQRYKAFGCRNTLLMDLRIRRRNFSNASNFLRLNRPRNKVELQTLTFRGILVGDLIYDDFLARSGLTTVNLGSEDVHLHLLECIAACDFLFGYFRRYRVVAVVGNHVYRQGLVPRFANHFGIPSYEISLARVARIDDSKPPFSEYRAFRELFGALGEEAQNSALDWSSKALELGARSFDITNYHLEFPLGKRHVNIQDFLGTEFSVVIALHCMSDSPHVLGNGYFVDYRDWVEETVKVCRKAGFKVLIKPHPACPDTGPLEPMISGDKMIELLPHDLSLAQLSELGLGAVVTYYGNIAFEAAMLGIPAVCGHPNNSYVGYSFVSTPGTLDEYRAALASLPSLARNISSDELFEYYYMSRAFFPDNVFVEGLTDILRKSEGGESLRGLVHEEILARHSGERFIQILRTITNFVKSGDQRLTRTHLAPADSFESYF